MNFIVDSSLSESEVEDIIEDGQEGSETQILITQDEGVMTWDNTDGTDSDYIGIINTDGTFSIFEGSFVDESNYIYKQYEGSLDGSTISGTFTAILTLDGTRLSNGLEGTCSVTQSFEGTVAE